MFKISQSLVQNVNSYRNGQQVSLKKLNSVVTFSGALAINNVSDCQQNVLHTYVQQTNYNRTDSHLSPFSVCCFGFFFFFREVP